MEGSVELGILYYFTGLMLASENGFGGYSAYWDDATVSLDEKVGYRDFGNPYCIGANETKLTVPKASKFSIPVLA